MGQNYASGSDIMKEMFKGMEAMMGDVNDYYDSDFYQKVIYCLNASDPRLPTAHQKLWQGMSEYQKVNITDWPACSEHKVM